MMFEVPRVSKDLPGGSDGKASVYSVRDPGSIPGLGRFPGEGNGNPLQYSCLENSMDGRTYHPSYLTSMQSTSCKIPGRMNHKLELRLLEKIPTVLDMQMIPL